MVDSHGNVGCESSIMVDSHGNAGCESSIMVDSHGNVGCAKEVAFIHRLSRNKGIEQACYNSDHLEHNRLNR